MVRLPGVKCHSSQTRGSDRVVLLTMGSNPGLTPALWFCSHGIFLAPPEFHLRLSWHASPRLITIVLAFL